MVTPFDAEGRLDVDGAVRLARALVAEGNDGLVLAGTTGEGATLSDAEKLELWKAVSAAVSVPVLAGAGSNDTAHSVELVREASHSGVAGILAVTPYYVRPSQAGLLAHFGALAAATDLPVVLYDIPVRTGRRIAPATLLRLAHEVPNIVGVKDATGDPVGAARLMAAEPPGFDHYSGDDALTLALVALGGAGVISVAGHWAGPLMRTMLDACMAGDLRRAQAANRRLLSSYDFESSEEAPNPVPAKVMLGLRDLPAGPTRLPMGPVPDGLLERARAVLADVLADEQVSLDDPAVS